MKRPAPLPLGSSVTFEFCFPRKDDEFLILSFFLKRREREFYPFFLVLTTRLSTVGRVGKKEQKTLSWRRLLFSFFAVSLAYLAPHSEGTPLNATASEGIQWRTVCGSWKLLAGKGHARE